MLFSEEGRPASFSDSIHSRLRLDIGHFVGERVGVHGAIVDGDIALAVEPGKRVPHPVLVIAFGKILTRIGAESLGNSGCRSPGVTFSAQRAAAARPNTTRSMREFEPSRLAPCTDTQAPSPSAISPGTAKSSLPFFLVSVSP